MDWKELGKKLVAIGLTTVGTALGGPAGGAVGALLGKAIFGGAEEVTPEKLMKAIGDPEVVMKLKQFEMEHDVALRQLVLESERVRLADVASARDREVRVVEATGGKDVNLYLLAWVIVLGFFGLVAILIFHELPKDSNGVIFMLFGALSAGFGSVIGYFFGSSKSSADKSELLAKAPPVK